MESQNVNIFVQSKKKRGDKRVQQLKTWAKTFTEDRETNRQANRGCGYHEKNMSDGENRNASADADAQSREMVLPLKVTEQQPFNNFALTNGAQDQYDQIRSMEQLQQ